MDGIFYYAVLSTGVYCRPSCHSRLPKRENVRFFQQRDEAERSGFRACKRCRPDQLKRPDPRVELVEKVCRCVEAHLDEPVTLMALSSELGMSPFHLQRTFKEVTGISPKAYADACRMRDLKTGLRQGREVTRALYDAGYGSSSRLYEKSAAQLGMTPGAYQKKGMSRVIRFSIADSHPGKLLVASTTEGICSIQFGDSEDELREALRKEFSAAALIEEKSLPDLAALVSQLEGHPLHKKLPLDIQATTFQRRVWEHLQSIPYGRTESYSQVARAIGEPKATRAVARACASNPVAVAIPCHRVLRNDGGLGGYKWGIQRKQALLDAEQATASPLQATQSPRTRRDGDHETTENSAAPQTRLRAKSAKK
jgi:AraC family transcriptional regulator of adaptative response/methylated-DNA-[protein]-cysteine methyltransferase